MYHATYPVTQSEDQPPNPTDVEKKLRDRLQKLERENARLRSENGENIAHLQSLTGEKVTHCHISKKQIFGAF